MMRQTRSARKLVDVGKGTPGRKLAESSKVLTSLQSMRLNFDEAFCQIINRPSLRILSMHILQSLYSMKLQSIRLHFDEVFCQTIHGSFQCIYSMHILQSLYSMKLQSMRLHFGKAFYQTIHGPCQCTRSVHILQLLHSKKLQSMRMHFDEAFSQQALSTYSFRAYPAIVAFHETVFAACILSNNSHAFSTLPHFACMSTRAFTTTTSARDTLLKSLMYV